MVAVLTQEHLLKETIKLLMPEPEKVVQITELPNGLWKVVEKEGKQRCWCASCESMRRYVSLCLDSFFCHIYWCVQRHNYVLMCRNMLLMYIESGVYICRHIYDKLLSVSCDLGIIWFPIIWQMVLQIK